MTKVDGYNKLGTFIREAIYEGSQSLSLDIFSSLVDKAGVDVGTKEKYNMYLFVKGLLKIQPDSSFTFYESLGYSVSLINFRKIDEKVQLVKIIYNKADDGLEFPLTKSRFYSEMVYGILSK